MSQKKKYLKSKRKKGNTSEDGKILRPTCIIIASLDLVHALYFVFQATFSCASYLNMYSLLSLLGTICWALIVLLCLVGLIKRRPAWVNAWLLFSTLGFLTDVFFFLWGLWLAFPSGWECFKRFLVVFIGIAIEFLCIYFVYCYYLIMDPCRKVYTTDSKGRRSKSSKVLDRKACKELKRARKKAEKKKKRKG